MADTNAVAPLNLGFLTVLHEASGYLGGYLVTNGWGRPLEFRLSTAVQPNRVQQILYGDTLNQYLCGELIGKTLIDKSATPAQWIITDHAAALELRLRVNVLRVAKTAGVWDAGCQFVESGQHEREQIVQFILAQQNALHLST